jgi:TPR repeat protein
MNIGDRWRVTVALWLIVLPCVGFAGELSDLQRKAENGEVAAQGSLGFKYANGQGVPQDDKQAVKWWRLAADQGDAEAQYNLGVMYANGQGVPQDYAQAHMWLNLAAANGNEKAKGNRDIVAGLMTGEQIAEAQKLAREWMAAHPDQ